MSLYALMGRIAYWVVWPGSWLLLRGSKRARLLLVHDDEILVVNNWLSIGKWNLPGGGVHRGEDPKLGLLRELTEETGIVLQVQDVRHLATEPYRTRGFSYSCAYFTASVSKRAATRRQKLEITAIDWCKTSEVSPQTHDGDVVRALQLLDTP